MAILTNDLDRVIAHRWHLESRFPTLAFHFYRMPERDPSHITVRVIRRDETGSYQKAAATGEWHDEYADPDTFPTDDFLLRCALIA